MLRTGLVQLTSGTSDGEACHTRRPCTISCSWMMMIGRCLNSIAASREMPSRLES